jgi:hypothetical protein
VTNNEQVFSEFNQFYCSDISTENLQFLSSEQALVDLAHFVTGMSKQLNLTADNKWIAFGGSYSG